MTLNYAGWEDSMWGYHGRVRGFFLSPSGCFHPKKKPVLQKWKTGTNFYKPERLPIKDAIATEWSSHRTEGSGLTQAFHRNRDAYFSEAKVCGIDSAYRIVDHNFDKKLIDYWILPGFIEY
jgi:hypothetical protein